jgi:hypothetical protein
VIAMLSNPPSGKPTIALSRMSVMLFSVQWSSRPPEEKNSTWYGTRQAPNSDIA